MQSVTTRSQDRNQRSGAAEDELIRRCRDGDNAAFAQLYLRHRDAAQSYALSIAGSPHAASDAVAEAFTRLYRLMSDGRGPQTEMRPYLLRIIRNCLYDEFNRAARLRGPDIDSGRMEAELGRREQTGLDDRAVWIEECASAMRALESLPERWQRVLWLVDVVGTPPRDLVDEFDTTAHNISALVYRAREGLRSAYLSEQLGAAQPGCVPYASRLGALARGYVGPQEKRRIVRHVNGCAECSKKVELVYDEGATTGLLTIHAGLAA